MDKELEKLKKRVTEIVRRAENEGYVLGELDTASISNIGNAKTMKEVNYLAIVHFEKLLERVKYDKYKK